MSDGRRYSEDEVAKIFERASESHARGVGDGSPGTPARTDGLSLAELEEIGDEVGIPRSLVRSAAAGLDRPPIHDESASRKLMGATIGVGKVVHLPRNLTDDEWTALVVDLRDTFNSKGSIRQDGPFRQWTQGNLQALLEPTQTGARLRLRTMKGTAVPAMTMGGFLAVFAGASAIVASSPGDAAVVGLVAIGGAALHLGARFLLPGWRRTRAAQMEAIIERLSAKIRPLPAADGEKPELPGGPPSTGTLANPERS